jgi:transcription elongation factor S-II
MRSLMQNLKDKNNPSLRESVASGSLPVERLCVMTPAELASEERKAQDRQMMEKNLFQARGAGNIQSETDTFKCGRCGQRKVCSLLGLHARG